MPDKRPPVKRESCRGVTVIVFITVVVSLNNVNTGLKSDDEAWQKSAVNPLLQFVAAYCAECTVEKSAPRKNRTLTPAIPLAVTSATLKEFDPESPPTGFV